jgi:lipoic acid synthetase
MISSKPEWLKIRAPGGRAFEEVSHLLKVSRLHTVCQSARCPNRGSCWNRGTATFQLMGEVCTRDCRFCASKTGRRGAPLDEGEIAQIVKTAGELNLTYVVLTSVCRDDLPLSGAEHFASAISSLKKQGHVVEALIPDFKGETSALERIIKAAPEVIGHNLETVPRLQHSVRCREADYHTSLKVLGYVKEQEPRIITKSSLMLGLGETEKEILATLRDLRSAEVDILTLGQYLQPSREHVPVVEYLHPEKFRYYRNLALDSGFKAVASAPFVRSSYKARELFYNLQGLSV